jgi:hypothetical protein
MSRLARRLHEKLDELEGALEDAREALGPVELLPKAPALMAVELASEPPADVAERSLTREQVRSRRKRAVRARTISVKRMPKRELELGQLLYPLRDSLPLPATRGDCEDGPRPCPMVSCRYHLYLDVSPRTGAIKLNFPDLEAWEMSESCALDVADRGGHKLEDVGAILNVTRERVRQLEVRAYSKILAATGAWGPARDLAAYLSEDA